MKTNWQPIETAPEHEAVLTKIDDEGGPRNQARLRRHGRLWFIPGEDVYVYYTPTHWARDIQIAGAK